MRSGKLLIVPGILAVLMSGLLWFGGDNSGTGATYSDTNDNGTIRVSVGTWSPSPSPSSSHDDSANKKSGVHSSQPQPTKVPPAEKPTAKPTPQPTKATPVAPAPSEPSQPSEPASTEESTS